MIALHALIFHTGYSDVKLGLARNGSLLEVIPIPKHQASRDVLICCTNLLVQRGLSLTDCAFLAAHRGPAPFTTLRVTLSTINGLAYARKLPLIGIDGLDAFVQEMSNQLFTPYLLVLLNAFCDDVYFALYNRADNSIQRGCQPITMLIAMLDTLTQSSEKAHHGFIVTIVGNAVFLYKDLLLAKGAEKIYIPESLPEIASIEAINQEAWRQWSVHGGITEQLLPLYLKETLPPCPAADSVEAECSAKRGSE